MKQDNTIRTLIPPCYTCVLQSCDVGTNKSLKDLIKKANLGRRQHTLLSRGQKLRNPKRKEIVD